MKSLYLELDNKIYDRTHEPKRFAEEFFSQIGLKKI